MFAFGSSTPRMLEPADTGGTYWATRRATSTNNVMTSSLYTHTPPPGPLTRRSSERELSEGNKKRATSAGGLLDHRSKDGEEFASGTVAAPFRIGAYRRKTDLMPTIPSSSSCRDSRTPGRAYSMSRLDVLSTPRPLPSPPKTQATLSSAKSMHSLPRGAGMLGKTADSSKSMLNIAPIPPPRLTRAERLRKKAKEVAKAVSASSSPASGSKSGDTTPSRPPSACSSASSVRTRPQAAPRRPRPNSIAVTGVTSPSDMSSSRHSLSSEFRNATKSNEKPPLPKVHVTKKPMQPKQSLDTTKKTSATSAKSSKQSSVCSTPALQSPTSDLITGHEDFDEEKQNDVDENKENVKTEEKVETVQAQAEEKKESVETSEIVQIEDKKEAAAPMKETSPVNNEANHGDNEHDNSELNDSMSQSMIAEKKRIATEEEAKAALAERRRLMREQQEREAELERQAQEAARLAELEAQRREEEEQRKLEIESLRLIEEAKKSEEARLLQAIQERQQREEEERKKKEEEQKQKLEREELERKAKEEAEKQRIEMEIRLKKEEEERQARKKRVEAIMLRTRNPKGSATNTPNKEDNENNMEKNDSTPNNNDTFSDHDISSKENESNGFNHTNGHHNGFSEKNNEQNVVSNNTIELNSHESKANVDFVDLGIPTIIPTETNVNNVNYNNSQVTDLLS
ncbi:hypothetical protein WDU94_009284 [Cyamophila willieti]